MDQAELKSRLLELFRSPSYQPPRLPAAALELLEMTRRPRVNLPEVVALLGRDPMLAGHVLKLSSSAQYSRGSPVRSLSDAVVRLGIQRVTDVFLQVTLETRLFRAPQYSEALQELRRHSTFTAEAARLISQRTTGLDEYAFLCGLLHDVGIAACILALAGPLSDLAPSGFEVAWPCIYDVHAECSRIMARIWGLPDDVCLVLSMHHAPMSDGHIHPLAAAVRLADEYSEQVGFGFQTDSTGGSLDRSARQAGIDGAALPEICSRLDELSRSLAP